MNLVSYFTLIFFTQTSLKISNRVGAWQYSPQFTCFWEAYVFIRFYSKINKRDVEVVQAILLIFKEQYSKNGCFHSVFSLLPLIIVNNALFAPKKLDIDLK